MELDFDVGEQRFYPRIDTVFSALYADAKGSFHEVEVTNLSKGGVFLKTNKPFRKGENIEVILMLPDDAAEVAVQGQVMHVATEGKPNDIGMGVMFTTVEPSLKEWLHDFIESLLHQAGGGQRRAPRVSAGQQPILLTRGVNAPDSVILCNISANGMFIQVKDHLNVFEQVALLITHPKTRITLEVKGEVVHLHKVSEKPALYGAGIRFLPMPETTLASVKSLIHDIMTAQRQEGQPKKTLNLH